MNDPQRSKRTWSISELAEEFGVSTRTIRFYEEKGYINPRRDGQRRIFRASDRTRIRLILRGKRIGMSLDECMEIIGMYNPQEDGSAQLESLISKIADRRAKLEQQKTDIDETLRALDDIEKLCRNAQEDKRGPQA